MTAADEANSSAKSKEISENEGIFFNRVENIVAKLEITHDNLISHFATMFFQNSSASGKVFKVLY